MSEELRYSDALRREPDGSTFLHFAVSWLTDLGQASLFDKNASSHYHIRSI
jgi:hypothetical protein